MRDDARWSDPFGAERSGDRQDRSRVDPHFDLTVQALVPIVDLLVPVDPAFDESF